MVGSVYRMPARIVPKIPLRLFLAERREEADLTQKEVGDRLGVSDVTISRWETGERRPDLDAQAAYAEAVGCDFVDLYRSPNEESADALLRGQPADVIEEALKIIRAIRR